MKYTIFESTNLASTHYAERIMDAVASVDVENGTFGYLDGLVEGETTIYNFVAGYKAGEPIVVADNPAWTDDTCKISNQRRDKYINESGKVFRVRVLRKLDEFGISIEGVTEASRENMKKGAFVSIDTTGKLIAASEASESNMVGEVMRERMIGGKLITAAHNYGYTAKIYEVKIKNV